MSTKNEQKGYPYIQINGESIIVYNSKKFLPRFIEYYANSELGLDFLSKFKPLQEECNPKSTKEKFLALTGLEEALKMEGYLPEAIDKTALWKYLEYCYEVRNMFSIYENAYIGCGFKPSVKN